jgi:hypothetical protein
MHLLSGSDIAVPRASELQQKQTLPEIEALMCKLKAEQQMDMLIEDLGEEYADFLRNQGKVLESGKQPQVSESLPLSLSEIEALRCKLKAEQQLDLLIEDLREEYEDFLCLRSQVPESSKQLQAAAQQARVPALAPCSDERATAHVSPQASAQQGTGAASAFHIDDAAVRFRPQAPVRHARVPAPVLHNDGLGRFRPKSSSLMIRHIPNKLRDPELRQLLEQLGLHGTYDYLYVPMNRKRGLNLGYFFVNFCSFEAANHCRDMLHGQKLGSEQSKKVVEVSFAHDQTASAQQANRAVHTAKS